MSYAEHLHNAGNFAELCAYAQKLEKRNAELVIQSNAAQARETLAKSRCAHMEAQNNSLRRQCDDRDGLIKQLLMKP